MKKLLILLLSILIIGCCNESKLLKNGLTKKATKITVYYIKIKKDSLNDIVLDTISIREKRYNNNDQIFNLFQKTLFDNETLEIDYSYNDLNKIKTEVVKMSTESSPYKVNYIYKDSLLHQSKSIFENRNFKFEYFETYYYRKNRTKKKISSTQTFVDFESKDTTKNSITDNYYDKNELIERTETTYLDDTNRNRKSEFKYDCGILTETKEYNSKDSLISKTEYKYDFDKFENWIRRESYINEEMSYIKTRKIDYK